MTPKDKDYKIQIALFLGGVMHPILEEISNIGIVPVISLEDAQDAMPLANALLEGGIACAQVTFDTCGEQAIAAMTKAFPQMLVGAGNVLTAEQADRAVAAGAKFVVSAGGNPAVIKHCLAKNIPVLPGCATADEVQRTMELGVQAVNFFPADTAGGLALLQTLSDAYGKMKFMITGGMNAGKLNDYLKCKEVMACAGDWMANKTLLKEKNWAQVTRLCKEAVALMLGFELRHVGINCANEKESSGIADTFEKLFGFTKQDRGGAYFAAEAIEVMKKPFYGTKGHIAIATNCAWRAAYRLEKAGVKLNWASAGYNPDGCLRVVYLQEEVGGFALHILQK